jgi:hypothetical protein
MLREVEMEFNATATVGHPPEVVLETMIERMEEIVPFLPNVASITTLSTAKRRGGAIAIERRWEGSLDGVPAALRRFVSPQWAAWIDSALWTPAQYKVEWKHTAAVQRIANLYACGGTNYFEPAPRNPTRITRVRITGELNVYPDALPGVPSLLGRRLAPQLETFIVNLLTPNLTDLASGLQRYLDEKKPSAGQTRRRG